MFIANSPSHSRLTLWEAPTELLLLRSYDAELDLDPVCERLMHSYFICVFEVRTNWHTHRDSSNSQTQGLQQLRKIIRGCFAFGVWVCREDDLLHLFFAAQALEQILDLQLIGSNTAYRRKRTM